MDAWVFAISFATCQPENRYLTIGLTWEQVEASAQDRHSWRQRVALCIGDAGWIKVKVIYPQRRCYAARSGAKAKASVQRYVTINTTPVFN